jgi:hypothetical protein
MAMAFCALFHGLAQLVQVICPSLHHLFSLREMSRTVVGAAVRIADGMRQLVLDKIRPKTEYFIEDRACGCAKTVS